MNKKQKLITLTAILGVGITSFSILENVLPTRYVGKASDIEYKTKFLVDKNCFTSSLSPQSGTYIATTEQRARSIAFSYKDLSAVDDTEAWQKIYSEDGQFTNTLPLLGLKEFNIEIVSEGIGGILELYYSYDPINDTSLPSVKHLDIPYDGGTFSFDYEYPRYIKVSNESNSDVAIKSMTLTYDCAIHNVVKLSSNDENKGIITSKTTLAGVPGEKVILSAEAKEGFMFLGFVKEDGTTLSCDNPYEHTIGEEDENIIAIFDEPMPNGLTVSKSEEKGHGYLNKYTGKETEIKIPTYAVADNEVLIIKKVGYMAFYDDQYLEKVILPDSITTICDSAFQSSHYLSTITLPASLETIEARALSELERFSGKIKLPVGLKNIGTYAFYNDDKVEWFMIPNTVTYIDSYAFYLSDKCKIFCFHDSLPSTWEPSWCYGPHVYWYSDEPNYDGDHWHLVDDEPVIWNKEK